MYIDKNGFYPYEFTSMNVVTTDASIAPITSGALVVGAMYSILETPTGGTPSFPGSVNPVAGTAFIATGTAAVWGTENTGKLVNTSAGRPTVIAFYNRGSHVFQWEYIYNDDEYCVSYMVTDSNGNIIQGN